MLVRRSAAQVLVAAFVSASTSGCKHEGESDRPASTGSPRDESSEDAGDGASELESISHSDADYVGRELPSALTGELHDAEGRIVVLAPGFVAASACIDCGAPSYLWFLAVRCKAETDCEVLTESCAGRIIVDGLAFTLAFVPNEGPDATMCVDYSGTFTKRVAQ